MKDAAIDQTQRTIAELMRTPVGRRWLLKMGVMGAAALAIPSWAAAQGSPAPAPAPRSRRGTMFQFDLGAVAHLTDLRLVANGHRVPLTPHDQGSRSALRAQGTLWRKIDTDQLSHFAAVPLPHDRPIMLRVYGVRNGRTVVVAHKFHTPATAIAELAALAFTLTGSYRSVAPSPCALPPCSTTASLGLDPAQLTLLREIVDLNTVFNALNSAIALTMVHPNVATTNSINHGVTHTLLSQEGGVCAFGTTIQQLHCDATDYVITENGLDHNNQPYLLTIKGTTTPFFVNKLNPDAPGLKDAARNSLVSGIRAVRNTRSLGTVLDKPLDESPPDTSTWHQPQGIVPRPIPYVPPTGLGATVEARLQNAGTLHGTKVAITGALSNEQLPSSSTTTSSGGSGSMSSISRPTAPTCRSRPTRSGPTPSTPSRWARWPRSSPWSEFPSSTTTPSTSPSTFPPPTPAARACCSAGSAAARWTAAGASIFRPTPTTTNTSVQPTRSCSPRS
jgi:hypothetical protein